MRERKTDIYRWLARKVLPKDFVWMCGIQIWSEITMPPYNSGVFDVTMQNALKQYARKHAVPGNGSDEHFDSNRNRP